MEEVRDNCLLLGAKMHVVHVTLSDSGCMLSAMAKSICSKYFISKSTAFDSCICEMHQLTRRFRRLSSSSSSFSSASSPASSQLSLLDVSNSVILPWPFG